MEKNSKSPTPPYIYVNTATTTPIYCHYCDYMLGVVRNRVTFKFKAEKCPNCGKQIIFSRTACETKKSPPTLTSTTSIKDTALFDIASKIKYLKQ